jgi:hypothetical protein
MALTDAKIRNTKPGDKPIKLTDGSGLYLEVRPAGAKLWRYRYRIAGKENVFAVGEYANPPSGESPEEAEARRSGGRFTLAEVREERVKARALVKQGVHPSRKRKLNRLAAQAPRRQHFRGCGKGMDREKGGVLDALLPGASRELPISRRIPSHW